MMIVIFYVLGLIISYFFIKPYVKPYLQTKEGKIKLIKSVGLLFAVSAGFYCIVSFDMNYKTSESFAKAEELLEKNGYILAKIGSFQSYTYRDQDMPKKTDNPATIRIAMTGSEASMYLSCVIKKDIIGEWRFISIKQDSLVKK